MLSPVSPDRIDAVLFDLDGVLATTARLQAAAWKATFDEFLEAWDRTHGTHTERFASPGDYHAHADDKVRERGIRDFLASRAIEIPPGSPEDRSGSWTVAGLAKRKQEHVEEFLGVEGVEAFPGSIAWIRELRAEGIRTGVVSVSRNTIETMAAAGVANLFDVVIDGHVQDDLDLAPKPAPDSLMEATRRLEVETARTAVVDDNPNGVAAARAAGFTVIIGVDRGGTHEHQLLAAGADLVVADLGELVNADLDEARPHGPREHRLIAGAARLLAAEGDYPVEEFRLVERAFNPDYVPQAETIFAVSNGYLGIRGTFDEGSPVYQPGTLLNGFYETWPITYAEGAYGFARTGQTILNLPDGSIIKLYVDDEPFDPATAEILEFERVLDMRAGMLERRIVFRTPDGRRFRIRSRRLVSFEHRHLATCTYEVTSLDGWASLAIASEVVTHHPEIETEGYDPRRSRSFERGVLQPKGTQQNGERVMMCLETDSSGLRMACGADHQLHGAPDATVNVDMGEDRARVLYRVDVARDQPVELVKYLAYHHAESRVPVDELLFRVDATLDRASTDGLDGVLADQRARLDDFWARADVRCEGARLLQQAVRFSIFQLLQASGRVEGHGIPAKGLTGQGYEGHYFWDTEIYVMPFLTYTAPWIARSLLRHRYEMLDHARQRALEVGTRGALFPWRTIGGEEASAYYAAGTAQYHINADIAYALTRYVRATGDDDFMVRYGAEILVETARMWSDLGFFSERRDGCFVINGVTGPDEYSTVVDNNAFTNLMARENLRSAINVLEWMEEDHPAEYRRVIDATALQPREVDRWRRAAELMYVPYDEELGVHLQDDEFLMRETWDFASTQPEQYPLLLHFHPLVIYRHQVIKQADVVLATFLLGHEFTDEQKSRIFEVYEPLTTGDSSLSACIHAIMAAEIGELRTAEEYFVDAASVDLADVARNVRDGVHVASAGGTWMSLVYGFAGLRDADGGTVSFQPALPERFTRLSFPLRVRDRLIEVDVRRDEVRYLLREGEDIVIRHDGSDVVLREGEVVIRPPAARPITNGRTLPERAA
ncbi:MAG: HAD-IA family hydrolase [Actinomycetota bacterium]|nr:HAD-IA family hydrolase [Actinomycetota bacterium]